MNLQRRILLALHFILMLEVVHSRDRIKATFSGSEFISYNLTGIGQSLTHKTERIEFSFSTTAADGFLFYTGDGEYYINVGLVNGVLYTKVYMDKGRAPETKYIGHGTRFDDENWHHVVIKREINTNQYMDQAICLIAVSVDADFETRWTETVNFSNLSSRVLALGGAINLPDVPGMMASQNFYGCLKGAKLVLDSIELDLLYMAHQNSSLLQVHGRILYNECRKVAQVEPVMILDPDDFIKLPPIQDSRNSFISLTFTTIEKDGLLLYGHGRQEDVIALEILDGELFIILQRGQDVQRKRLHDHVIDGIKHSVAVTFRPWGAGVLEVKHYTGVDGVPKSTMIVGDANHSPLQLEGPLYLAGIDYFGDVPVHPAVYTASLKKGFVGCIQNVKLDGNIQDLTELAMHQGVAVGKGCKLLDHQCTTDMCAKEGFCTEGWNRPICDCTMTAFAGKQCEKDAVTAQFNGSNYFTVALQPLHKTMSEEFTVRFRTVHSYGQIISTNGDGDMLEVRLLSGRLIISYSFGSITEMIVAGERMNDNRWHVLTLHRRDFTIIVKLDNINVLNAAIKRSANLSEWSHMKLSISSIRLGLPYSYVNEQTSHDSDKRQGFVGSMQHFLFNGVDYLDLSQEGDLKRFNYTCEMSPHPLIPSDVISVHNTSISIPHQDVQSLLAYTLKFRSLDENGLILYHVGNNGDFLGVELLQGVIRLVYKINGNTDMISSNLDDKLNDNKWHYVIVTRLLNGKLNLRVDEFSYTGKWDGGGKSLDLTSHLVLAGVVSYMTLPSAMMSSYGFSGCFSSLEFNGYRPNVQNLKVPRVFMGCSDKATDCSEGFCHNGGICAKSDYGETNCICDMTTYRGVRCNETGITLKFSNNTEKGLAIYNYPVPEDTYADRLAFRVMTRQSHASVLRVTSANSDDKLEVTIRQGRIMVTYNIGTGNHNIGDVLNQISDGKQHIIRFTRNGRNSTLQIDNNLVIPRAAENEVLSVFNGISQIQIGGGLTKGGDIRDPFFGEITGLSFNGIAVSDQSLRTIGTVVIYDPKNALSDSSAVVNDTQVSNINLPKKNVGEHELIVAETENSGEPPCHTRPSGDDCNSGEDEIITIYQPPKSLPKEKDLTTFGIPIRNPKLSKNTTSASIKVDNTQKNISSASQVPLSNSSMTEKLPIPPVFNVSTKTFSRFEIEKNIPLIAGISGAGLITLIIIAVVVGKLTTKPKESPHNTNKKNHIKEPKELPPPPDEFLLPDEMNIPVDSNHNSTGGKEWYV